MGNGNTLCPEKRDQNIFVIGPRPIFYKTRAIFFNLYTLLDKFAAKSLQTFSTSSE